MKMIDRENKKLSISRQAKLLSINRTSLYYKSAPISDEEYLIKRIIDEVYTSHPEYGYRRMTTILNRDYGFSSTVNVPVAICARWAYTASAQVPTSVSVCMPNIFIRIC
jgi:putative transposase